MFVIGVALFRPVDKALDPPTPPSTRCSLVSSLDYISPLGRQLLRRTAETSEWRQSKLIQQPPALASSFSFAVGVGQELGLFKELLEKASGERLALKSLSCGGSLWKIQEQWVSLCCGALLGYGKYWVSFSVNGLLARRRSGRTARSSLTSLCM